MNPVEILSSIADFSDANFTSEWPRWPSRRLGAVKPWKIPNYLNSFERNQSFSETVVRTGRNALLDERAVERTLKKRTEISFVKML